MLWVYAITQPVDRAGPALKAQNRKWDSPKKIKKEKHTEVVDSEMVFKTWELSLMHGWQKKIEKALSAKQSKKNRFFE